jgi:uncharacterized protein
MYVSFKEGFMVTEGTKIDYGIFHEGKEFWEGIERSELLIQRCQDCGRYVFYPREFCPHDMGQLTYERVSGRGRILTYSVVVRTGDPRYAKLTPFVAAVVQLNEGPTMYSRIDVKDPSDVTFNQEVEVVFTEHAGRKIPLFQPINNA